MKKRPVYQSIIILTLLILFLSNYPMLTILASELVDIVPKLELKAIAGVSFTHQLDIDNSKTKVIFILTHAPEGIILERTTGMIEWTPTLEQVGEHRVDIVAIDGFSKNKQELTVTVVPSGLSSIAVIPVTMDIEGINNSKNIESITAHYTDGSSKIIDKAKCNFQSEQTNVATVNNGEIVEAKNIGTTTITVSYTEEGITKNATITVNVTLPVLPSSGGG
jgi:hypothetical protein